MNDEAVRETISSELPHPSPGQCITRSMGQSNFTTSRSYIRTGCLTCKSRHLKCDEQKPACLRCISSKRICGGYPSVPQTISTSIQRLNDQERRGFLYFQTWTARRVFGHRDADEWMPILLHFGINEVAARHAIVALAFLHESREPAKCIPHLLKTSRNISDASRALSLKHYNLAIIALTAENVDMTSQPDLVMVLCLLFLCFEQLRSDDAACLVHLLAGLRLVNSWRSATSSYASCRAFPKTTQDLINNKITPILQRIRVQFAFCMDLRHELRDAVNLPQLPPPNIPYSYESLNDARKAFDRTMNYVFATLRHAQTAGREAPVKIFLCLLEQWKQAVDRSDSPPLGTSVEDRIIIAQTRKLLEIYYHTSIIITATYTTTVETAFDDFNVQFEQIVELGQNLMQHWSTTKQQYSCLFSFDLGLTPPLFLVASRCRDDLIRRKAVDLMLHSPFYHGVWQDRYSGLCAQRIIEIEEQNLTTSEDYVPEHQRIRKTYADLQEDVGQIIMHYTYPPFSSSYPIFTTCIKLG